jgi:hypothetical protein
MWLQSLREELCLQRYSYNTEQFAESQKKFRENISLSGSGSKNNWSQRPAGSSWQAEASFKEYTALRGKRVLFNTVLKSEISHDPHISETSQALVWSNISEKLMSPVEAIHDRVCGLVVRVLGYSLRGPGFDFRCYHIFWEVVGLERDPLVLVWISEEILGSESSCCGLENRD